MGRRAPGARKGAHMATVPPRRLTALLAFPLGQAAGGVALLVTPIWSNTSGAANYFHLMAVPGIAVLTLIFRLPPSAQR